MKSRTKPSLRVLPAAQVQLSLAMDGVLRDVRHAFYGLCVNAGKQVLAAMMEADRVRLCGAKGVPDANRRATRGGHTAGAVVLWTSGDSVTSHKAFVRHPFIANRTVAKACEVPSMRAQARRDDHVWLSHRMP